ncbi:MAG TPA: hypothetical protein VII29_15875 [Terriglobales bacterium]
MSVEFHLWGWKHDSVLWGTESRTREGSRGLTDKQTLQDPKS